MRRGLGRGLDALIESTDSAPPVDSSPARPVMRRHISDPLLEDMLLCPLLFYGSASEYDMDFSDFAMLYQAVFLEGLARPFAGIRPIKLVSLVYPRSPIARRHPHSRCCRMTAVRWI